ncbi:MAG: hypothetical protein CL581_01815 [Alteromonadaceae bacterium]|nr:hypothetical protein [Alteromonadaceae bacterium]MBH87367.1 hypothetical protein [Alteromonadaceae bacterium]
MSGVTPFVFRLALVLAGSLLSAEGVLAGDKPESIRVGLAQYALVVGKPTDALHWVYGLQSDDAGLVRGQAYADLGLPARSETELESRIKGDTPANASARLTLAKEKRQLGKQDEALALLKQLHRSQQGAVGQEASFLLAENAIASGAFDLAGKVLGASAGGYWTALGYLNLATAYARQDKDTARSLIALRVARSMLDDNPDAGLTELIQRIQITAGYLALRSDDPEKAISFLNKVALKGYRTPQALYLHGLAEAQKENYRAAMQSWHRARKFPLGFPGAAEAWLGMGRGYDESGYLGLAGEAYLAAIAAFQGEVVTLDTLMKQIRQEGGYHSMVLSARSEDVEWFLADSKTLTQPRLAYLMHFMEGASAQKAVRRVASLDAMEHELQSRSADLVVFRRMLENRLRTVSSASGAGDLERLGQKIEVLADREAALRTRLNAAESGDGAAIASGETAKKLAQVRALKAKGNLTAEESARVERLEGVLKWQAQEQYDLARREHEKNLDVIARSLAGARSGYDKFESERRSAPDRFRSLLGRVESAQKDVDRKLERLATVKQRSEEVLDAALLEFLQEQSRVMSAHLDRSEQQIAHLYEYLAVSSATGQKQEASQ